jgi:hypothetical protein
MLILATLPVFPIRLELGGLGRFIHAVDSQRLARSRRGANVAPSNISPPAPTVTVSMIGAAGGKEVVIVYVPGGIPGIT